MKKNVKIKTALRYSVLVVVLFALFPSASATDGNIAKVTSVTNTNQAKRITGVVKDENGEPMIGVTISLAMGTGTITDVNGVFTLNDVPENGILTVSYVGYKEIKVSVAGKSTIEIILEPDNQILDEVVVIGYGVQKKSNVTGSISSLKADDLRNSSISNATSALQGKVAGVQVVNNSGAPGATPAIRIRGYSSNGSSDPLYIVDGLKVSDIGYLEPSNIKSMEVLKDAASAAIYGAEAGNGVILITTKSGEKGQTQLSFDAMWTYSTLANKVDLLDADQYKQYYTEVDAGGNAFMSDYNAYHIEGTNTNWQDEMYETGVMQKYNLSAQGGNESGNFFLSLGYMDNDGMVKMDRDYYKRFSGQANASYKIKPWLEVGTNNTITNVRNSTITENDFQSGIMKDILLADPLTPVFYTSANLPTLISTAITNGLHPITNDNGDYYGYSWAATSGIGNPLAAIQNIDEENSSFYINGMTYANIKPFNNFVFTTRLGYTLRNSSVNLYSPSYMSTYTATQDSPLDLESSQTASRYYQWENFFNYMLETKNVGFFSVMAGISYSDNETDYIKVTTNKLSSEAVNFRYPNYSTNDATDLIGGNRSYIRKMAYYGRLSWDYLNRYNVQANFRADSYDAAYLDLDHNWGYFPSISAGWVFSYEDFMKNVVGGFFTYGKLRASYGINGSISNLGNYMYAATLQTGQASTNGTANTAYWLDDQLYQGTYPSSILANPKLRWERSKQFNLGLDLRFVDDRLTATIDYYNKLTDGLLIKSTAPLVTGAAYIYQNLGKVSNSGIDVELEWRDKIGDFNYSIKGNIATIKNTVKEYKGEGTRIGGSKLLSSSTQLTYFEEGYPLWYIRGYKMTGVDEATGEPIFADFDGEEGITEADRTNLGNGIPKFTYGLTLTASYKNFDLMVYGAGASGHELVYAMMTTDPNSRNNRPSFLYNDRWTAENTKATMPNANAQINDMRFYNSDAFVFDASFFKIKQIQLGYTLPKRVTDRIRIGSVRGYASLDNFFTFTKYPGSDPENNASSNAASAMALDYGSYPIAKSVSFGINVTF